MKKSSIYIMRRAISAAVFALSVIMFATSLCTQVKAQQTNNGPLAEMWTAYNEKQWATAIAKAADYINENGDQAAKMQDKLLKKKEPVPEPEEIPEADRARFFARGILNDVATCYFYQGEAYVNLKQMDKAKKAYEEAAKLTYALTWDTNGWFWSPSGKAKERLASTRLFPPSSNK